MRFDLIFIDSISYRLQYEIEGVSKDKVFEFGKLVLDDGLSLSIEPVIKASKIINSRRSRQNA